jgi:hypothetical protein
MCKFIARDFGPSFSFYQIIVSLSEWYSFLKIWLPFSVVHFMALSVSELYSVELEDDCWDMNRKGSARNGQWPEVLSWNLLKGLRKITERLSPNGRCPSRDSKLALPDYRTRTLSLLQPSRFWLPYSVILTRKGAIYRKKRLVLQIVCSYFFSACK